MLVFHVHQILSSHEGLENHCRFADSATVAHLYIVLDGVKMNGYFILLASIFSLTYLQLAEGYIVDTTNGNDNNSGETINDPFKTIARCVAALSNPGDECLIRAGYYHEFVNITDLQGELISFNRTDPNDGLIGNAL